MQVRLEDLKIGEKLEICLIDKDNNDKSPYYSVKLQNIRKNEIIEVDLPMLGTQIFSFKINQIIRVTITQEDGIYSFSGEIIENNDDAKIPVMVIKLQSEIIKNQRRSFFRIKCNCNIKYKIIENESVNQYKNEFKNAAIIDLSGGGMCISCNQKIDKNILLECVIMLENNQEIVAICKVIKSKKDEESQSEVWKIGLVFHAISERSREKLINFVFQEQLKLRRKGLV